MEQTQTALKNTASNLAEFKQKTETIAGTKVPVYTDEFWTAKQRQGNRLHEVSYRACFKPQLVEFFLNRFSQPGDIVYDPFAGRGTTLIESALNDRIPYGNDINPLSKDLCLPRLNAPSLDQIAQRIDEILAGKAPNEGKDEPDLSMFFEKKTLGEIKKLRAYLSKRRENKNEDYIDAWIRMVATNRLTGHSQGFFSVYTLPPNQAATAKRQIAINKKRGQKPTYRDTKAIILKKSKSLQSQLELGDYDRLATIRKEAKFFCRDASKTKNIQSNVVQLIVTSPPFVDVVQYQNDNWMRLWFNNLESDNLSESLKQMRTVDGWSEKMKATLRELYRITKPGGFVAFEVGEVHKGKLNLDELIVPLGIESGFNCEAILINSQSFTKTANIWGIGNNKGGTNTNRIVLFSK